MGLIDKINYTLNAVNDISLALKERGINIDPVVLKDYGDIIRNLDINSDNTLNGINVIIKTGYSGTHLNSSVSDSYSQIEIEE